MPHYGLISSVTVLLLIADSSSRTAGTEDVEKSGSEKATQNELSGFGYSSDMQHKSRRRCFNAKSSSTGKPVWTDCLNNPIRFKNLEDDLGMQVDDIGNYEMFDPNPIADFLRSLKDKDNTFSLNFYAKYSENVAVQIENSGIEALNKVGREFYQNNRTLFGLLCGDKYITQYERGALFILGLNIEFSNRIRKKFFEVLLLSETQNRLGNITEAIKTIGHVSSKYEVASAIAINVTQIGGELSSLNEIINKPVSCAVSAANCCMEVAHKLQKYAFKFKDQTMNKKINLLTLRVNNYESVNRLDLKPPVSLVNIKIEKIRKELSEKLIFYNYISQKLTAYIVWCRNKAEDISDDTLISLFLKAENDKNALMDKKTGASQCFDHPQKCNEIHYNITKFTLKEFSKNEIKFVANLKCLKPSSISSKTTLTLLSYFTIINLVIIYSLIMYILFCRNINLNIEDL